MEYSKKEFGFPKNKNEVEFCLGPGYCLPRTYFEKFIELDIDKKMIELVHDEIRVPFFAHILGFKTVDTKICLDWFSKEEHEIFNCMKNEIKKEAIVRELGKENGRRVFHPYYKMIEITRN